MIKEVAEKVAEDSVDKLTRKTVGEILMEEFNNQEIQKQKEVQRIAREEAESEVERLKLEKQER